MVCVIADLWQDTLKYLKRDEKKYSDELNQNYNEKVNSVNMFSKFKFKNKQIKYNIKTIQNCFIPQNPPSLILRQLGNNSKFRAGLGRSDQALRLQIEAELKVLSYYIDTDADETKLKLTTTELIHLFEI